MPTSQRCSLLSGPGHFRVSGARLVMEATNVGSPVVQVPKSQGVSSLGAHCSVPHPHLLTTPALAA